MFFSCTESVLSNVHGNVAEELRCPLRLRNYLVRFCHRDENLYNNHLFVMMLHLIDLLNNDKEWLTYFDMGKTKGPIAKFCSLKITQYLKITKCR